MDEHQMKDEALRLALEALGHFEKAGLATLKTIDAITAIKQALEQPVATNDTSQDRVDETAKQRHEPVAIRLSNGVIDVLGGSIVPIGALLYTSPPKREWQGLTEDEISKLVYSCDYDEYEELVRATEAKLKERNT